MCSNGLAIKEDQYPKSMRLILTVVLCMVGLSPCLGATSSLPDGADLKLERIQQAIKRGIEAIYRIPPPETFRPAWKYSHWKYRWDQELHHEIGNHALAAWALLACGESYQNPRLFRRLNIVLAADPSYVFDRGMRALMLAHLPRDRWARWVNRDGLFLTSALTEFGNFNRAYTGGSATGAGDNAHGQYGVLGLAGLDRAGWRKLAKHHWMRIDAYWRAAQQTTGKEKPAGWAIYSLDPSHGTPINSGIHANSRISGPMTAGAVAVLYLTERAMRGPRMDVGQQNISPELRKGLAWLDQNFMIEDEAEHTDRNFYYFTIQSVGRYTGYRTFNGIDWFRRVTAKLLAEQQPDGSWTGPKGRLLSTSFALLYLSRANDPLAITKIRWSNPKTQISSSADTQSQTVLPIETRASKSWNNRPHDIWNFVDYASDLYEASVTWQIAELNQPVYELIESPVLYLATDDRFDLTDDEIDGLRRYIDAGGLLITNPEGGAGAVQAAMRKLAGQLFASRGHELVKVPSDSSLFHLHARNVTMPMQMVHNGVRPLMIHFMRDIGEDLQRYRTTNPSFSALSNIYLFATGMKPQRPRLANHHVVQLNNVPQRKLSAARLQYSGNHDPEPSALTQLQALLANDHDIDLSLSKVLPEDLADQQIAFLTTTGRFSLDEEQTKSIGDWIRAGGTLWIDIAGGNEDAIPSVHGLIKQVFPDQFARLLHRDDPIIDGRRLGGYDCSRVSYRIYTLRLMHRLNEPRLEAIHVKGRPAIIFSTMDLTSGLAGLNHWRIFGYTPQSARQLVVNGCLSVLSSFVEKVEP